MFLEVFKVVVMHICFQMKTFKYNISFSSNC